MPLVAVTAALLRATYLAGIPLGAAWDGATGTQRLDALIRAQIEIAESQSRLLLCPRKVLTYPDPAEVRGVAYTLVGEPIPVVAPLPGEVSYRIALRYSDVASVERVRLFEGMTACGLGSVGHGWPVARARCRYCCALPRAGLGD
jgi:hypothetical protein